MSTFLSLSRLRSGHGDAVEDGQGPTGRHRTSFPGDPDRERERAPSHIRESVAKAKVLGPTPLHPGVPQGACRIQPWVRSMTSFCTREPSWVGDVGSDGAVILLRHRVELEARIALPCQPLAKVLLDLLHGQRSRRGASHLIGSHVVPPERQETPGCSNYSQQEEGQPRRLWRHQRG